MGKGIVLKVENLNVELGGERILENLSFEVKEGEVLTILFKFEQSEMSQLLLRI